VPTRSFLQVTMGWFLRDQKLAMLQTPHHFYSPDPFERNLDQFRIIPNEGELVLRRGAGRQRLLERDVLLRVVRGAAAQRAG
jgi:cellulose synthase/poly-beta-1,6-N-acetylglucosamine synthase-like glycosyltransferase